MARDYKDTWKKKSPARTPVPGWVWLASGLAIGLFVAFLIWLDKRPPVSSAVQGGASATSGEAGTVEMPQTAEIATTKKPEKNKSDPKSGSATAQKPRFDFYTILPEMEVIVPAKEAKNTPRAVTPGAYFLQAGSFKNLADADTLKARLALLGMEAKIEPVTVEDATWYRVRLGPFKDMEQLNKMLGDLRQNNINALPVRVKS